MGNIASASDLCTAHCTAPEILFNCWPGDRNGTRSTVSFIGLTPCLLLSTLDVTLRPPPQPD